MAQVTTSNVPGWFDEVFLMRTTLHVHKTGRENKIKGIGLLLLAIYIYADVQLIVIAVKFVVFKFDEIT